MSTSPPLVDTSDTAANSTETTATTNNTAVKSANIQWHDQAVKRDERWKVNGHDGTVLWFTGLSGSGKSSIANQVEVLLNKKGISTYLLDGDNIRHGLCKDLGFSIEDRSENIRRVGQVAKLMADAGTVVLTALISPYRKDRDLVRSTIEEINIQFVEIHVNASLETCEGRDPKGLYKMARQGKITNFTGIDDPYEEPVSAEIVLYSNEQNNIDQLSKQAISWLEEKKIISLI